MWLGVVGVLWVSMRGDEFSEGIVEFVIRYNLKGK